MEESQNIEYKESWRDECLRWICGFANAQGGTLYIGVNDNKEVVGVANSHRLLEDIPNKIVTTLGIVCDVNLHEQDGLQYIEIVVEPSNMPIAYRGEYHYRSGATKQQLKGVALQQFILKKMGMTWDDSIHPTATINSIDENAVRYFLQNAIDADRLPPKAKNSSVEQVLSNMDLIDDSGHLKNAAILLFGKRPQQYFTGVEFKIGRFIKDNTDLIIQDVIGGNILQMADEVLRVLRSKYLIAPIRYEGMVRKEPLEIPESSLREAIYNAIVHKDYTGVAIQMKVWNDRIELWNDGNLPDNFTINTLLSDHTSKPRNRNIAHIFYMAGFIESWGRGIDKIRKGLNEANLPEPIFKEHCGGLLVTIKRSSLASELFNGITPFDTKDDTKDDTKALTSRQYSIIQLIRENHTMVARKMASALNVSIPTIKRDLSFLTKAKIIIHVGSPKDGHWEILRDIE